MTETTDAPGFNPFGELLGLRFSEMADGRSTCLLELRPDLLNPFGVAHGGVLSALADTAMGGALFSALAPGERCATAEMRVAFIRPASSGALHCQARVVHRGRRVAHLEAEVRQGETLIAKAAGTFSISAAGAD